MWATPTSCTDVRHFIGLVNHYRKLVLRFSALAAQLTALCSGTEAPAPNPVGSRRVAELDALQVNLTAAPVHCIWDPARLTRLLTTLRSWQCRPSLSSRTMPAQSALRPRVVQADAVGMLVPLAIAAAAGVGPRTQEPWAYFLNTPFEPHTDNATLQWLQQQRHLSHHQAQWLNLLTKFQNRVVYIPGRTKPADFLVRKRRPGAAHRLP